MRASFGEENLHLQISARSNERLTIRSVGDAHDPADGEHPRNVSLPQSKAKSSIL